MTNVGEKASNAMQNRLKILFTGFRYHTVNWCLQNIADSNWCEIVPSSL